MVDFHGTAVPISEQRLCVQAVVTFGAQGQMEKKPLDETVCLEKYPP